MVKNWIDNANKNILLQPVMEKRIRKVYKRMQIAEKSARHASFILYISVSITFFLVCGNLLKWFDVFLSFLKSGLLVSGFIVTTFTIWCYQTLVPFIEVILIKEGLKKLRYPEWEYLSFVVLDRPIRSSRLLSDPTVIFIIGHLFRRKGFDVEAKELIDKAVRLYPSLETVTLSKEKTLSAEDENFLDSELDRIVRNGFAYKMWRLPLVRGIVITVGIISIVLHFAVQLVRIFYMSGQ